MSAARSFQPSAEEAHLRALARQSANEDLAEHDLGLFIELTTSAYDAPEHLRPLLDALDRSMTEPVYALVESGTFDARLYYRLNTIRLELGES